MHQTLECMNPQTGRALWISLHAFALFQPDTMTEEDANRAQKWLDIFTVQIKENSTGCKSCSTEWARLIEKHPPTLTGATEFYLWTVAAHDWINRKLGKPIHAPHISLSHPIFVLP